MTTARPSMDHRTLRQRLAVHRDGTEPVLTPPSVEDSDAEVDWHGRISHLRQLIHARRRRLGGAESPLASSRPGYGHAIGELACEYAVSAAERELDRTSLGSEMAEGVRLVDERLELSAWLPAPDCEPCGQILCFDTETTGLRGGAGLWVWMVGVLIWRDGHWRLRQWWLERPGAERRYLELLLADFNGDAATLVSFNGKSYDLPHLATRLGLNEMANPLPDLAHVDLLHALRRRYGKLWPDCRLRTAEERLLDLHRSDDLPGSEAPRSWREYLTMGRWQGIAQVLAHNRQDLLSLARLMPLLGTPENAGRARA